MLSVLDNRAVTGVPGLLQRGDLETGICALRPLGICQSVCRGDESRSTISRHEMHVDAHRMLFSQEEDVDAVYIVRQGVLRLSRLLTDARRHVTGFALVGDLIGWRSSNDFGVTAETLTPVTVCRFERAAFLRIAADNPCLLRELQAHAAHELAHAQHQMMLLGRGTAEEKVAGFLVGLRQRYMRIGQVSTTLELPMRRQDIADHLGLTTETVCRMLTRLERAKIILLVPGGVRVLARTKLERLALV